MSYRLVYNPDLPGLQEMEFRNGKAYWSATDVLVDFEALEAVGYVEKVDDEAPRREILRLASFATGHWEGVEDRCLVCRERWPCNRIAVLAKPALDACGLLT